MNLFPTQNAPTDTYLLTEGLIISPYKRVCLTRGTSKIYYNSIRVGANNETTKIIKKWLLFHCFIFNENKPIKYYESGTLQDQIEILDQKIASPKHYDDIFGDMYFIQTTDNDNHPRISYQKLYTKFCKLGQADIDLIKNCLMNFGRGDHVPSQIVLDYSYWELMMPYSVIDGIIGQQDSTCTTTCPVCNKSIPHHSLSENKWIENRLAEIMGNNKNTNEYLKVILAVRDKIRHSTVHSAVHPTAEEVEAPLGSDEFTTDRSIKEFKTNSTALFALKHNLQDIARYLLINRVFGLSTFPKLRSIKTFRIGN